MEIVVHPRIHERHEDISAQDVIEAMNNIVASALRDNGHWCSIGFVLHARPLEMIYKIVGDVVIVYHALTPPTKKFQKEVGFIPKRG